MLINLFYTLGQSNISRENQAASQLFIVMKDHSKAEPLQRLMKNKIRLVKSAASEEGFELDHVDVTDVKPVQIYLGKSLDSLVRKNVIKGFPALRMAHVNFCSESKEPDGNSEFIFFNVIYSNLNLREKRLKVNLIFFFSAPIVQAVRPTNKLCQAIDVLRRVMEEENCKLHRGYIYKFIPESTSTYTCYKSVKDYAMKALGNPDVADVLANHVYEVSRLLSEESCKIIRQLVIDYNYIECSNGRFFDIKNKTFVNRPENLAGSPRAFVLYKEKIRPNPVPFIEGKYMFQFIEKCMILNTLIKFMNYYFFHFKALRIVFLTLLLGETFFKNTIKYCSTASSLRKKQS